MYLLLYGYSTELGRTAIVLGNAYDTVQLHLI